VVIMTNVNESEAAWGSGEDIIAEAHKRELERLQKLPLSQLQPKRKKSTPSAQLMAEDLQQAREDAAKEQDQLLEDLQAQRQAEAAQRAKRKGLASAQILAEATRS
jgi:hypothetical protein